MRSEFEFVKLHTSDRVRDMETVGDLEEIKFSQESPDVIGLTCSGLSSDKDASVQRDDSFAFLRCINVDFHGDIGSTICGGEERIQLGRESVLPIYSKKSHPWTDALDSSCLTVKDSKKSILCPFEFVSCIGSPSKVQANSDRGSSGIGNFDRFNRRWLPPRMRSGVTELGSVGGVFPMSSEFGDVDEANEGSLQGDRRVLSVKS
jgi:hypothetical protein